MTKELWSFFRNKLGKGNGVWWALRYTRHHWKMERIVRDPVKHKKWLDSL